MSPLDIACRAFDIFSDHRVEGAAQLWADLSKVIQAKGIPMGFESVLRKEFWRGYAAALGELSTAIVKAVNDEDFADIDQMHSENEDARIYIEDMLVALKRPDIAKEMAANRHREEV